MGKALPATCTELLQNNLLALTVRAGTSRGLPLTVKKIMKSQDAVAESKPVSSAISATLYFVLFTNLQTSSKSLNACCALRDCCHGWKLRLHCPIARVHTHTASRHDADLERFVLTRASFTIPFHSVNRDRIRMHIGTECHAQAQASVGLRVRITTARSGLTQLKQSVAVLPQDFSTQPGGNYSESAEIRSSRGYAHIDYTKPKWNGVVCQNWRVIDEL